MKLTGLTEEYPEVPTIPSTTEKLIATLENIPIEKLVAEVMHAVQSIDNLVTSPEVKRILQGLDHTLLHIDGVVGNVDKTVTVGRGAIVNIDRVINDGGKTIAAGQDAIVDVRELLARGGPALEAALREFEKLAKDGQKLAVNADGMVNADSPLRDDLANTLREIQAAARSLRVLTDYLDQHPEAVISGKRAQQRQ
jgi:paraquat-inducible protein B